MEQALLDRNFTYHKPTDENADTYLLLRSQAKGLAELFNTLCPEGREKSLAFTKLEEAVMWANAGIARSGAGSAKPVTQ